MLQALRIKNYAIIEEEDIRFSGGLNIITGETGAGKSILLGALDLLLGARADSSSVLDKESKCIVEAVFLSGSKVIEGFLEANDLDIGQEIIIRREISTTGKSRAFINDTPVLLAQLREFSRLIVDMHQQFAVLEIQDAAYQMKALDAYASITSDTETYSRRFREYKNLVHKAEGLRQKEQNARKEKDYLEFQLKEFETIGMSSDEVDDLEAAFKRLSHAREIKEVLQNTFYQLEESDQAILDRLKELNHDLKAFRSFDTTVGEQAERLDQLIIELNDISMQLQDAGSSLNAGEEDLKEMEEQLNTIRRLQLKHAVQTPGELFRVRDDIQERLDSFSSLEKEIAELENQLTAGAAILQEMAEALSHKRHEHIGLLESAITTLLHDLKMAHASIRIDLTEEPELNIFGKNKIQYMFAPNKGSAFAPIRKVASGGELSRLSLCIKAIIAQKMEMPVLVFDEIDQGVSGEVARRMGEILGDLASYHQVIMITHSPQIASRARSHHHVLKKTLGNKTVARVSLLPEEDRIIEIAKMLSGDPPTEAAVMNAKELIHN